MYLMDFVNAHREHDPSQHPMVYVPAADMFLCLLLFPLSEEQQERQTMKTTHLDLGSMCLVDVVNCRRFYGASGKVLKMFGNLFK